jgi:class 3 adenylate cyclase
LREEVTGQFRSLSESVRGSIGDLATGQNIRLTDFAERLDGAKNAAAADATALREEIQGTLQRLGENVGTRIGELIATQGEKLDGVTGQISALTEGNERRQETLRDGRLVKTTGDGLLVEFASVVDADIARPLVVPATVLWPSTVVRFAPMVTTDMIGGSGT